MPPISWNYLNYYDGWQCITWAFDASPMRCINSAHELFVLNLAENFKKNTWGNDFRGFQIKLLKFIIFSCLLCVWIGFFSIMRLCNSGIIFLILACCTVVLSVELTRNKPSKDLLKLSMPSKARINAKRFRRDADPTEPPNKLSFGMDKEECMDPTSSQDREITNFDVSLE